MILIIIFILLISNCSSQSLAQTKRLEENEFSLLLDSLNLKGSILVYDQQLDRFHCNDFSWAESKFTPASTFKIPNSIIGLETGVLSDSTIFEWDGKPRRMKIWDQDLNLVNAFQYSCVPCYQENARKIGLDRMKEYLQKLNYPGMIFDKNSLDKFWLEGESRISSFEQMDFIIRFHNNKLPISKSTKEIMMKLLKQDTSDNATFYGKTGWAIRVKENIGWFVGFQEVEERVYFVVVNVKPKGSFSTNDFLKSRITAAKKAIKIIVD